MTLTSAIEKAIAGGWHPGVPDGYFDNGKNGRDRLDYIQGMHIGSVVLNPDFWRALGKTEAWDAPTTYWREATTETSELWTWSTHRWVNEMHSFVQHLADGGTIESYFETL